MIRTEKGVFKQSAFEAREQWIANKFIQEDDCVLELGARYGGVSRQIQSKLRDKALHVAVEPDARVLPFLEQNLEDVKSEATIWRGIVSRDCNCTLKTTNSAGKDLEFGTHIVYGQQQESPLATTTVEELELKLGRPFTVLVADCEGCLGPFVNDFPDLFKQLRMVTYEQDRGSGQTDYEKVKALLLLKGFKKTFESNTGGLMHYVYEK